MKKVYYITMYLFIISMLYLTACSGKKTKEPVSLPNPVRVVSGSEAFEEIGLTMRIPEKIENAEYSIINDSIAQINFSVDQVEYNYRGSVKESDISGIYEEFDDQVVSLRASYSGGDITIEIKTTKAGNQLASFRIDDTSYSLYSKTPVEIGIIEGLTLELIECQEKTLDTSGNVLYDSTGD